MLTKVTTITRTKTTTSIKMLINADTNHWMKDKNGSAFDIVNNSDT
jgi:hypothetical protein